MMAVWPVSSPADKTKCAYGKTATAQIAATEVVGVCSVFPLIWCFVLFACGFLLTQSSCLSEHESLTSRLGIAQPQKIYGLNMEQDSCNEVFTGHTGSYPVVVQGIFEEFLPVMNH
jgi:hypothetical protein